MFLNSDSLGIISEYCASLSYFTGSEEASGPRITFSSSYTNKRARSQAIILTAVFQDLYMCIKYTGAMLPFLLNARATPSSIVSRLVNHCLVNNGNRVKSNVIFESRTCLVTKILKRIKRNMHD